MDPLEKRNIVIGGKVLHSLDALEDFCWCFPEFEEEAIEILEAKNGKAMVNTYWIEAELAYGDGGTEMPFELRGGWFGDVLIDQDG